MRDALLALYLRSIAANIRRLRARRGLTQESLAERAGIDLSYEQRVERGVTNLSINVLVALAGALGVAPSVLLHKAALPVLRRGRPRTRRAR